MVKAYYKFFLYPYYVSIIHKRMLSKYVQNFSNLNAVY